MRIERFDAVDASRGIRDINAKYGDDVLIIARSRVAGKIQFVIAVDTEQRPPKRFTPESLVMDFGGANTAATAPAPSENPADTDAHTLPALAALISAGFRDLKSQLDELRHPPARSPGHVSGQRVSVGELSLSRLVRLMSGSTVPIALLQTLSGVTAGCTHDIECITAIRAWLQTKLRETPALEKLPTVHFLVGAPGVGKTLQGMRLAATLNRTGEQGNAVFVSYKPAHEGALSSAAAIGQALEVHSLQAGDFPALVSLVNEHISTGSLVVELPANLHTSELLRLQQRLPSAAFHLVIATDRHVNAVDYVAAGKAVKFSSAMISGIDYQGVSWNTIHALIENDVPLMWGSHSSNVEQPLLLLEKSSIIDDVMRAMSDLVDHQVSVGSVRFGPRLAESANKTNMELM